MKRTLQSTAILLTAIIALGSCKSSKVSIAQRKADIEQSKEATTACFIQLNDGTIKNYKTLTLVTGVLKTPYLLADGKIKILGKDIKAYQNKEHYAISQESFTSGHKSYVAKETLPGFAIRIAKGKINVYAKKFYNGVGTVDEYFIQKGDDGKVMAYTTANMNELAKDDDNANNFFATRKFSPSKPQKDPAKASYDNSTKIVTKNK